MSDRDRPQGEEGALRLALDALFARGSERARGTTRPAALARPSASPEAVAEQLARARASLRAAAGWSERRERRWRAALLAHTTRRDLSWRGDLALLRDFLHQRLRASPALRVVAASLALHVVAAPAVAYWVLREGAPERRLTLRVELAPEADLAPDPGPRTGPEDELVRLARIREARANERARERFLLIHAGPSAPPCALEPAAPVEVALLAERARSLRTRSFDQPVREWSSLRPLGLALWLDLESDRLVLTGQATPALAVAAAQAQALASGEDAAAAGTRALLRSAASRATRLGLTDSGPTEGHELLSPAWFEALERAGTEAGLAELDVWKAWLAWRGR